MSNNPNAGGAPLVQTMPLWLWDTAPMASGYAPVVSGYPLGGGVYSTTKTGLQPSDLQNFVGVPMVYYGNPPVPVASGDMLGWIRQAEDKIEQDTSVLLCQTWVASPPAQTPIEATSIGVVTASGYQIQGIDYDWPDAAYDFMFNRAQDEGWMYQTLRYRPVQSVGYTPTNFTAVKNIAYVYPLLNTFFRVPPSWTVEDRDFGLVRLVPAQNVQMLPLFAMQLAFMGFAESVPGALWFQYTAGLTAWDYQNRWSFMKQLVLCEAAITALMVIQGGINLGATSVQTLVDGLQYRIGYPEAGPYNGLIERFSKRRDALMHTAMTRVAGPFVNVL